MAIDPAIAVTSELSGAERSAQRTARLRYRPRGRTAALGLEAGPGGRPALPSGGRRGRRAAGEGMPLAAGGVPGIPAAPASNKCLPPGPAALPEGPPPPSPARRQGAPRNAPRPRPRGVRALRHAPRSAAVGAAPGGGSGPAGARRGGSPLPARPACPAPQLRRRGAAYLRRPHKGWPLPSGQSHPPAGARCLRPPSAAPVTQAAAAQVSHQSLMRGGRATERQPPSTRPGRLPPNRAEPRRASPPARRLGQRSGGRPPRAAPLKGSAPPPPPPRPARPGPRSPRPPSGGQGTEGPGREVGGGGGAAGCWFTLAGPERSI